MPHEQKTIKVLIIGYFIFFRHGQETFDKSTIKIKNTDEVTDLLCQKS